MVGSADKNKRGGQNYLLPPGNALRLWHLRSRRGITTAKELTWTADQAGSSQALTATFRRCANVGRSGAYGERARGVAGGRMLGHWGLCGGQRTWTGIRPRIWCWVATGTNKAGMLRRGWILQRYLDPTGDYRNFPISRDKLHLRASCVAVAGAPIGGAHPPGAALSRSPKKIKNKTKSNLCSKSDPLGVCFGVPLGLGLGHASKARVGGID